MADIYHRENYDIDKLDPHWTDKQIVQLVGRGKNILDVGCATGYIGKYLKEKNKCRITGIELNPDAAKIAQASYETVLIGNIEDTHLLEKLTANFDVIICSNILEHCRDPLNMLIHFKKHLNPEGYFILAIPNIAHYSIRLALLLGNFNYTEFGILDNTHLRFFTLKTMRQLIHDAGLKIEYWSFDWDCGIPKFNRFFCRLPKIGPWFLKKFYSLSPTLFGFQFIFKAKSNDQL